MKHYNKPELTRLPLPDVVAKLRSAALAGDEVAKDMLAQIGSRGLISEPGNSHPREKEQDS